LWIVIVISLSISYLFASEKNVSLTLFFFSFIASSLSFSFNFLQLRSRREWKWIRWEETVERGWRWCFLCLVLLLILNQIGRRNRREESIKLTEKRTKSWQREKDNKESVEFYGMINGRKLCGLLLSVLKSLMWLIILPLTKWMYLMRTFLISPSNP